MNMVEGITFVGRSDPFACDCGNRHFLETKRFERNGCYSPDDPGDAHVIVCVACRATWTRQAVFTEAWTRLDYPVYRQLDQ